MQLATLYSSHDDYVSKVTTATAAAQQAGFILAADAPLIAQEAQSAPVPQ
jgi:sigma54-dependent transcription regulator